MTWHNEPLRHKLSALGVKTCRNIPSQVYVESVYDDEFEGFLGTHLVEEMEIEDIDEIKIPKIENISGENKPCGGFWTSSLIDNKYYSEWHQYMREEMGYDVKTIKRVFIVKPKDDAKLYEVNSIEDWYNLFEKYTSYIVELDRNFPPTKLGYIDFELLSKDFDGLRISNKGLSDIMKYNQMARYYKDDMPKIPIDEWDVESTLWFRNVFDKISIVEEVE